MEYIRGDERERESERENGRETQMNRSLASLSVKYWL
jgi:hypothetical protein